MQRKKKEYLILAKHEKKIAATNRQPQNVISSLTLLPQAKAELKGLASAVLQSESRVVKAGKTLQSLLVPGSRGHS